MKIEGKHYRTSLVKEWNNKVIQIINQKNLPHQFIIKDLSTIDEVAVAIKEMYVRGAGLIGATAAHGIYLAALAAPNDKTFYKFIFHAGEKLKRTRPTAANLALAVEKKQILAMKWMRNNEEKIAAALKTAHDIANEEV